MADLLGNDDLEQNNLPDSPYGFSSVAIDDLGATEYTILTMAIDVSGSTSGYLSNMEKCVRTIISGLKNPSLNPRMDNFLVRIISFDTTIQEIHGFKELYTCDPKDYNNFLKSGGSTALNDAIINSMDAMTTFAKKMSANDFTDNNGYFVCLTDGGENGSIERNLLKVRDSLRKPVLEEVLQTCVSMLIGVGTGGYTGSLLSQYKADTAFDTYQELDKVDEKGFAKLANLIVSQSVSQSQSLATKGPSKVLTF